MMAKAPQWVQVSAAFATSHAAVLARTGATCVAQVAQWRDLLALGPDLAFDIVVWLDPPADEATWVEAIEQLQRLRAQAGVLLVYRDAGAVGPVKVQVAERRRRGQVRSVAVAADRGVDLLEAWRELCADLGFDTEPAERERRQRGQFDMLRPLRRPQVQAASGAANAVADGKGRIVAVMGAKGGVGKTTVAVNLASLAATAHPGGVVLLDLDLEGADVGVHLDLLDELDVIDLLPRLQQGVFDLPTYEHGSSFAVIPGPVRPDLARLIEAETVADLLARLRERFRWIIVDTGARLNDEVAFRAIDVADHRAFIITADAGNLRMARFVLEHAERLGWSQPQWTFVLNQAYADAALSQQQIADFLGQRLDVVIPADRGAVDKAILTGRPLVLSAPQHPVAQGLRELAAFLGMVAPRTEAKRTPPLLDVPLRLLGRLQAWRA